MLPRAFRRGEAFGRFCFALAGLEIREDQNPGLRSFHTLQPGL
jgi:hypothetical protein